jgi:AcrR family transcriptional regulator
MELFLERGFEAVTVADVARAADVSERTVFHHFATKEDLVFSRGDEKLTARVEAIRSRPPGVSLTQVFEAETMAWLDRLAGEPLDDVIALPRLVRQSPALHHRLMHLWESEAAALATGVTDDQDDLVAATVVRALVWAHRLVFRAALRRVLAGEDPAEVAEDLRAQARQVYARLDLGLAGYGS